MALINLTEGKSTKVPQTGGHYKKNLSNKYRRMPKKYKQKGSGRTLNVPKTLPPNTVPGPSFNGAVTVGEACVGSHCSIPVTPLVSNMVNVNLNSANPPPGANVHYPGTDRLGNSGLQMPGIKSYVGTKLNHGPHNIQCAGTTQKGGELIEENGFTSGEGQFGGAYLYITNPDTNRKVSIFGRVGKRVLKNYLNEITSDGGSRVNRRRNSRNNRRNNSNRNNQKRRRRQRRGNTVL